MKRIDVAIILAILGITLLIFSNLFSVPFLYDDYDFLFTWIQIKDFAHIPVLLLGNTPIHHEGVYRPLRSLFYVLSYHFNHQTLFLYHLQELCIYTTCIILVYLITRKLIKNRIIASITTTIFAIHPMHIDNVANLTANFDTIGIVWFFFSFYFFQRYAEKGKKIFFILSCLSCTLAFFTYEITLVLPLLILLYCYYKKIKKGWYLALPSFGIAIGYLLIRLVLLHITSRGAILPDLPEKVLVTVKNIFSYLFTALLPLPISKPTLSSATGLLTFSEAPQTVISIKTQIVDTAFLFPLLSLLLLIFMVIPNFRKRSFYAFCLLWFFISLLPVVAIGLQYSQTQLFWNRYAFIASYGMCLLLGKMFYLAWQLPQKTAFGLYIKTVIIALFIVLFLYYAALTHYNISQWKDQRHVLIEQIMKNTNNANKYNDLGVIAASYQQYPDALKDFNASLKLDPTNLRTEKNLEVICSMFHQEKKPIGIKCP